MLPELCAWWLHINKKVAKADESSIEKKNQCSANQTALIGCYSNEVYGQES